ncbi:MAG: hypothetical protein JXB39_01380 [Deltaproteobacteria bacterium]|nr:hypothetical protein [Deltaproteobacteria bacterium]
MRRTLLPLLALSLASACDSSRNTDDTGTEMGWDPCTTTTTVVGFEEVTPLGFSAADLVAVVGGSRTDVLQWFTADGEAGDTTDLTFEVTYAGGEVRYVDAEPREGTDTGGLEYAATVPGRDGHDTAEPMPDDTGGDEEACPDTLEVDVTFTFATSDGAFDESADAFLYAYDLEVGHLSADLPYEDLVGSYVPTDPTLVPSEWEAFTVSVGSDIAAATSEGEVLVGGHRDMGDGTSMGFQGLEAVWPPGSDPW